MPDHVNRIVQAWRGSATWTSTRASPKSAPPAAPRLGSVTQPRHHGPAARHPHRYRPAMPCPPASLPLQTIMNG